MARSTTRSALPAHVDGALKRAIQVGWVGIVAAFSVLSIVGFVRAFRDPLLVALPPLTDLFVQIGLDFRFMMAVALALPWSAATIIAWVIFWRRSDDPTALLFALALFLLHTYSGRSLLTFDEPVLRHALSVVFGLGMVCLAMALVTFPNGRFAPPWTRGVPVAMAVLMLAHPEGGRTLLAVLEDGRSAASAGILIPGWSVLLVVGVISQVIRYRTVSTADERQQTKWVMLPLGVTVAVFVVVLVGPLVVPATTAWVGWALFLVVPLGIAIPIGVAFAVLRLNLYAIDHVVSRTVTYLVVVAVLAAIYATTAVTLGTALSSVTGERNNELVVAASVLLVSAVFRPVRLRTRRYVERRFNRAGFERARIVGGFLDRLDGSAGVPDIERDVVGVVAEAFQPVGAGLWLAPSRSDQRS